MTKFICALDAHVCLICDVNVNIRYDTVIQIYDMIIK